MRQRGELVHISLNLYRGLNTGETPEHGTEADESANMHVWVAPESGESFVMAVSEIIEDFLQEHKAEKVPSPEAARQ